MTNDTWDYREWVIMVQAFLNFIGIIFLIYKNFSDPDVKAASQIGLLQQGCKLKHERIDENIETIKKTMNLIQENDLKHIEQEIGGLKENQIKIFTILDERLPSKNKLNL